MIKFMADHPDYTGIFFLVILGLIIIFPVWQGYRRIAKRNKRKD